MRFSADSRFGFVPFGLILLLIGARPATPQGLVVSTFAGFPPPMSMVSPFGAVWADGRLYVTDLSRHVVLQMDPSTGESVVLAGRPGVSGLVDGVGASARFAAPAGIATDGVGNLYVTDLDTSAIRRVRIPTRDVTTLAGGGGTGSRDGRGREARFYRPQGVTVAGPALFVTDSGNATLRRIELATLDVTTFAGLAGSRGHADGFGANARFDYPFDITIDGRGNLYMTDTQTLRKISIATGEVSTRSVQRTDDGPYYLLAQGLRFGIDGALYVSDWLNLSIRRVDVATGDVTTVAGSPDGYGFRDGVGPAARFWSPYGIAVSDQGILYVADPGFGGVRRIDPASKQVTTLAPRTVAAGTADGFGLGARFAWPSGLISDGAGSLFVADEINQTIRRIDLRTGRVSTVAGAPGESGSEDGIGLSARFMRPTALALDHRGNLYVSDTGARTIRRIVLETGLVTTIAGLAGYEGAIDGPGATARFRYPGGLAADGVASLYISEQGSHTIRRLDLSTGAVTTIAGTPGRYGPDDGVGAAARFTNPSALALDGRGALYIADGDGTSLRRLDLSMGTVTTVAGVPWSGGWWDGVGTSARFRSIGGLSWDGSALRISDYAIRRFDPATRAVSTISGRGYDPDSIVLDGPAATARFGSTGGLAWDAATASVYIADRSNRSIRRLAAPANGAGCAFGQSPGTLCLRGGDFEASVTFRNQYAGGVAGTGVARLLARDTGAFTFFDPGNVELVLKVLDGRAVNGRYWVLYGALSDVEYTLTVTNVQSGQRKTYHNPPGTLASVADLEGLAARPDDVGATAEDSALLTTSAWTSPEVPLETTVAASCATLGPNLCLRGRFLVTTTFRSYSDGATGRGQGANLGGDSGTFWFFDPDNLELVVKVLDGRSVNGRFWVAYGALSDVEYTLDVTDTETGRSVSYHNPPHTLASRIDVGALP